MTDRRFQRTEALRPLGFTVWSNWESAFCGRRAEASELVTARSVFYYGHIPALPVPVALVPEF